jgi:7-keto-8-aminopelargonate synthetase-like enzyme
MLSGDLKAYGLGDFWDGHPDDPLLAPPEFGEWRAGTTREQALFQRPLCASAGPRTLVEVDGKPVEVINFASLDYLGLNRDPMVAQAIREALGEWGVGACGVPLLTGTSRMHKGLESEVSSMLGREDTMLFPSGFSGGVGIASALLRRGDVAIADEKAHMCWLDGVRTAGAQLATFAHNDVAALDQLLTKHSGSRRVVIVDGLYSMDGDVADLPALLDVADAHGVGLIVDEAHSIFALGASGGGVTEMQGMERRVRLLFGTFSKGISLLGGFASASRSLLEYTRLYAHPFGFSAAMPPAWVAGIRAAVALSVAGQERRTRLAENARYWRSSLQAMGLNTGRSSTHVVPIIVGSDRELLYSATLKMLERGLYLIPIDYPAVPEDAVRLRTSISAAHSRADMDAALGIIEDTLVAMMRSRGALRSHGG